MRQVRLCWSLAWCLAYFALGVSFGYSALVIWWFPLMFAIPGGTVLAIECWQVWEKAE